MSFYARESSEYSAAPVELYTFTHGDDVWHLTPGDAAYTFAAVTYDPVVLARRSIQHGKESPGTELEIDLPISHALVTLFSDPIAMHGGGITLSIRGTHRGDSEAWSLFVGVVGRVKKLDLRSGIATIGAIRLDGLLVKAVPRLVVGPKCQYMLYGPLCKADPTAFQFTSTIASVGSPDARVVSITGLTTAEGSDGVGRFIGGILLRDGNVIGYIMARLEADTIWLRDEDPAVEVGATVVLYPGCDRDIMTCVNRFNNVVNFGGWHVKEPNTDPFNGRFGLTEGTDQFGNPLPPPTLDRPRPPTRNNP